MDGKNHKDVNQWQNQKPFIAVRYVDMKAANGTDSVLPVKLGIVWKKMCRFLLLQKLAVGSGSAPIYRSKFKNWKQSVQQMKFAITQESGNWTVFWAAAW